MVVSYVVEMLQYRVWLVSIDFVRHVSNVFLSILINPSFHGYVPLFLHKYGAIDGDNWSASEICMHARKMDNGIEISS